MRNGKKFILNAMILTITSLILRTASVSFTAYISGRIGSEAIGVFQLIMSVYMFAITLATSGIGLATTRLVAEKLACNSSKEVIMVVKKCIYLSIFFSLLSSTLLYINADFIVKYWLHEKVSVYPIYVLCISLPFLAVSSVLTGYFTAVRRVIKSSSAQILEQFILIIVTVYFVSLLAPKGLEYACLALVIGGAISTFLSSLYLFIIYLFDKKRYCNNVLITEKSVTSKILKISLPVAISSCIRSALATYKQIMIPIGLEKSGMTCDVAISQYGIIRGMVMPVLMFPAALLTAFSSLLIPEFAEKNIQKNNLFINYMISRIFKITLIFSVCISSILFFYSNELSMLIYKNLEPAIYIKMLSPLILIMYLDDIVDAILKGLNEQVSVVGINIFDTIVSIILLYTLLPIYNINGYIIVIFVSEILNGFLSIKRLIKVTYFELKFFYWIVIPTVVMIIAIMLSKILITNNILLEITFSISVYLLVLHVLNIITNEDFTL